MTIPRSRIVIALVVVAAAILIFLLWPHRETRPEDLIRAKVVQVARAAEKKDLSFVMDQISEHFQAPELGGKDQLKGLLAYEILQGSWVRVFVVKVDVTLTDDSTAEMHGKFVLGRSEASKVEDLGKDSSLSPERIDATFKKESDGEWRVITATHKSVSAAEMVP